MHASTEQDLPAIPTAEDIQETIDTELVHWSSDMTRMSQTVSVALVDLRHDLEDAIGKLMAPALVELEERRALCIREERQTKGGITLDPNDPFDSAVIPMVETNRKKRADYARDGDPFDNFKTSSELMGLEGFGQVESALFNMTQKMARLKSLRQNGRMDDPQNEAVIDTYLDLAVYGVLTYAQALERQSRSQKAKHTAAIDDIDE